MVNGVEVVRENVGTFQVLNQASADYTLRTKINLSAYRDYELKIFTSLSTAKHLQRQQRKNHPQLSLHCAKCPIQQLTTGQQRTGSQSNPAVLFLVAH